MGRGSRKRDGASGLLRGLALPSVWEQLLFPPRGATGPVYEPGGGGQGGRSSERQCVSPGGREGTLGGGGSESSKGRHRARVLDPESASYEKPPPGLIKKRWQAHVFLTDQSSSPSLSLLLWLHLLTAVLLLCLASGFLSVISSENSSVWKMRLSQKTVYQMYQGTNMPGNFWLTHQRKDFGCPWGKKSKLCSAHEDPMYDIIRENKRHEKDVRIQQLKQLLEDSTSDEDGSSSSSSACKEKHKKKKKKEKHKKRKKEKKKKKKRKHKSSKSNESSDSD
ncbi:hypothetical protein PANDA_010819 [Ailuropoda melanoleuca]|uniref:Uncharacterized protein n=1 Tax=Ailuropoda melanoleuca TaxID=9646 RepID=D2HI34_AILME|nr:hypothetical protein PANDA_010819 [Ailuropoda melanoleuca]